MDRFEKGLFESAVWQARVSIQRRLESGATKKFEKIMLKRLGHLKKIKTGPDFKSFHQTLIKTIMKRIKQNKKANRTVCSYGYAQKLVNIFLKYYIYWYKQNGMLKKFLHCPLDSQVMDNIYRENKKICDRFGVKVVLLSKMSGDDYKNWQKALTRINKEHYHQRYLIELDIMFWPKKDKKKGEDLITSSQRE